MTSGKTPTPRLNIDVRSWYRDGEGYPRPVAESTNTTLEVLPVEGTWPDLDEIIAARKGRLVWSITVTKVAANGHSTGKATQWINPDVLSELDALRKSGTDTRLLGWTV